MKTFGTSPPWLLEITNDLVLSEVLPLYFLSKLMEGVEHTPVMRGGMKRKFWTFMYENIITLFIFPKAILKQPIISTTIY